MSEIRSSDRRYWVVEQGDGNFVVYDLISGSGVAVWDRWSHELNTSSAPPIPPNPPSPPNPGRRYSLRNIRVTNENDGTIFPRMVSYWPNSVVINNTIYVFVGTSDWHPKFFSINRDNGQVSRMGTSIPYAGTGEGWYWDLYGKLYIPFGPKLLKLNPFGDENQEIFDINNIRSNCDIWQVHSSNDGQVHSATVRERSSGAFIGTYVLYRGREFYFAANQQLDESALSTNGEYLIIKEGNDNRIITLATGQERFLSNNDGAVGHSDCGPDYVVGEDDIHGTCVVWNLNDLSRYDILTNNWNLGHISVANGKCLRSSPEMLSLLPLDGSGEIPLYNHGMRASDYDHQVQANLAPSGECACYISDVAGRFDAYVLDGIP